MPEVSTEQDTPHLRRALELAEGGRGRVSPNPMVGAVLVRDEQVIGEGFHAVRGELHAERAAIEDARARGQDPVGSTIYVTLEPCEMCLGAMFHARVARVVYGATDPKKKVLKPQHTIEGGVLAEECGALLSGFFAARR